MNLSYSTDILQHSAWRVRTAEQLVLIMRPPIRLEMGNLRADFQLVSWFRLEHACPVTGLGSAAVQPQPSF